MTFAALLALALTGCATPAPTMDDRTLSVRYDRAGFGGFGPAQGSSSGGAGGDPTGYAYDSGEVQLTDSLRVGGTTHVASPADGDIVSGGASTGLFWHDASSSNVYFYGNSAGSVIPALIDYTHASAQISLQSTGIFAWSSGNSAAVSIDAQLARNAAGRIQLSDPSGTAGARLDLLDAPGTSSVSIYNSSNHIYLQAAPSRGIDLRVNGGGTSGAYLRNTGFYPLQQDGSGVLGNASYPWGALTLGDGTAQVTLQGDGVLDGLVQIVDPNGGAAQLDLCIGTTTYGEINVSGAGILFRAAVAGDGFTFAPDANNSSQPGNLRITDGLVSPVGAGGVGLGTTALPFGSLTLGDATAQVTLGHDGSVDGKLEISDPNTAQPGYVDLNLAAGTTGGVIRAGTSAGQINLGSGSNNAAVYVRNQFDAACVAMVTDASGATISGVAGNLHLGSTSAELGDVYTSGTIYLGAGQAGTIVESSGYVNIRGTSGVSIGDDANNDQIYVDASGVYPTVNGSLQLGLASYRFSGGYFGSTGLDVEGSARFDNSSNSRSVTISGSGANVYLQNTSGTTTALLSDDDAGLGLANTYKITWSATGDASALSGPTISVGSGSPESSVTAPVGSLYLRTDGGTSTTLYVKTSGTGNTGWTAK